MSHIPDQVTNYGPIILPIKETSLIRIVTVYIYTCVFTCSNILMHIIICMYVHVHVYMYHIFEMKAYYGNSMCVHYGNSLSPK